MATLAQVTRETRLILKISAVLFVVLIIVFFTTNGIGFIKKTFFPKPPPPPQFTFGQLPAMKSSVTGTAPTQYIINTVSGLLPEIGTDRLTVYKIIKPVASITALKTVETNVQSLNFSGKTKVSDTQYQWSDNLGRTLSYDIVSNNFDLTSNYISNASAFPAGQLPADTGSMTGTVNSFLQTLTANMGVDLSDITVGNGAVTYYTITNGQLTPVDLSTNAQIARVDLFQNDVTVSQFIFNQAPLTTMKIYYPTPNQSTMNFNIAYDATNNLTIEEAHFIHQSIDMNTNATYPVQTVDQAFKELQAGKGMVFNTSTDTTINIKDATVGYYLGPNQDYIYPIYIFTGNNFVAYVPALSDSSFQ